jgi:hypothetical protein
MFSTDIVGETGLMRLQEMPEVGVCGSECATLAKACQVRANPCSRVHGLRGISAMRTGALRGISAVRTGWLHFGSAAHTSPDIGV